MRKLLFVLGATAQATASPVLAPARDLDPETLPPAERELALHG